MHLHTFVCSPRRICNAQSELTNSDVFPPHSLIGEVFSFSFLLDTIVIIRRIRFQLTKNAHFWRFEHLKSLTHQSQNDPVTCHDFKYGSTTTFDILGASHWINWINPSILFSLVLSSSSSSSAALICVQSWLIAVSECSRADHTDQIINGALENYKKDVHPRVEDGNSIKIQISIIPITVNLVRSGHSAMRRRPGNKVDPKKEEKELNNRDFHLFFAAIPDRTKKLERWGPMSGWFW